MNRSRRSRLAHWFGAAGVLATSLVVAAAQGGNDTNAPKVDPNPPLPRKPCIILIVADDLGWGDLGCYGQTKIKTPNIDALAAGGIKFTSYYAGSSLSAPARTALLTGRDTGHTANRGVATFPVPLDEPLIPQVLKQSDYVTAAEGKWGLGAATPAGHRGFDNWAGFLDDAAAQDYYPATISRTRMGEDAVPGTILWDNQNGQKGRYVNDLFLDVATNFLRQYKPELYTAFRGNFLYLAPTIPYASLETQSQTAAGAVVPNQEPYATNTTWLAAERTRAAMISRLDSYIGVVTNWLHKLDYDKNTIIILTSATGPQRDKEIEPTFFKSTGPFRGFKHDLYEGGIRVPLIVRWPVQIRPGQVSDLPCAAWDILPTLAEAARAEIPKNINGISLLPTLLGKPQKETHDHLYWELHDHGFKQALRLGDWKAVRNGAEGSFELYDLKGDPGEKTDVAAKNPEVLSKITGLLKTARTDDPNWPVARGTPADDDGTRK